MERSMERVVRSRVKRMAHTGMEVTTPMPRKARVS